MSMILSKTNNHILLISTITAWVVVTILVGVWMWWQLSSPLPPITAATRPLDEVSIKSALEQIAVDHLTVATGSDTLNLPIESSSSTKKQEREGR